MKRTTAGARCHGAKQSLVAKQSRIVLLCLMAVVPSLPHEVHAQQAVAALDSEAATGEAGANMATIKGAYDAFSRGDIDTAMAAFSPDIEWYVPGRGPLSRTYRGHGEVLGFFDQFMKLSNGTFRLQVSDVLGAGDRVVVLCTTTAQRAGRTWTSPQVHVWTFKDGKAAAFREYEGDQQTEDEFWALQE